MNLKVSKSINYKKRDLANSVDSALRKGITPPPTEMALTERQMRHYWEIISTKDENLWVDSSRQIALFTALDLDQLDDLYLELPKLAKDIKTQAQVHRMIDATMSRVRSNYTLMQIKPSAVNGTKFNQRERNSVYQSALTASGVTKDNFSMTEHQRRMQLARQQAQERSPH